MPAVLFKSHADSAERWGQELTKQFPGLDYRIWPAAGDKTDVDTAIVWKPERGMLRQFPNLKMIFSLGAGVDHIFADPELPKDVPVIRLVDPWMANSMAEYVALNVLRFHRDDHHYQRHQAAGKWKSLDFVESASRRVGFLGMGFMAGDCAAKLKPFGFDIAGWTRSPKAIDSIKSFHGADGLAPFLKRTDILVCLLPATPETAGILNARNFAQLPRGSFLIQCGRGAHTVEADLLAAMDSGHLAAAALDVFPTEPLPPDNPVWRHPNVFITPHVASQTNPRTGALVVAENMRRVRRGEAPRDAVDPKVGY
ncbi:MAG: glyoxylate/hydroxypyruvate reductase A [Alphaproteobacteria bacterium]|nr:glyoxylate/hydroxypyruvate reductase A [Alphaproteobacteria bacterium]